MYIILKYFSTFVAICVSLCFRLSTTEGKNVNETHTMEEEPLNTKLTQDVKIRCGSNSANQQFMLSSPQSTISHPSSIVPALVIDSAESIASTTVECGPSLTPSSSTLDATYSKKVGPFNKPFFIQI